ncbi:ABC transporter permease [Bradyrhizobium sp. WSM3983]|uniref:ABC transporter permease n=1 Tax=Bradyrhizobium sp. WSM3983 TaxID=1038867 RepID=UPI00041C5DCE|nr:ABC transporter permease [Bradyrhizobium sp. WSM3983]
MLVDKGGSPRSQARWSIPLLNLLGFAICFAVWWLVTSLHLISLPTPLQVGEKAIELIRSGQLPSDVLASIRRVLIGFALGVVLAVPVGFLVGWYRVARGLIEPPLQFLRMIPPLAIIPLAIVTLGIDEIPKIFVIFLASFLATVVATYQGVITVDATLINAARVLGAKDFTIFIRVLIPASIPFIFVGVRIGMGSAWATLVASELIAAQSGLGFRMQQAQLFYDLPTIFVCLFAIGFIGLIMDRVILAIERKQTAWQERA